MSRQKIEKIVNIPKKTKSRQIIMAKGFMGEPVQLDAKCTENNYVEVVGKSRNTKMRLKDKYIYQYGVEVCRKLNNAYKSGDKGVLTGAWDCTKPLVPLNKGFQIRTLRIN